MTKKALSLSLVLIGAVLLIAAVVFWINSKTTTEAQSLGQSLRDWIILIVGLGSSIKGWVDLAKKDTPQLPTQNNTNSDVAASGAASMGKDIVANIISEDSAYNVEGLLNPYLGLRAFTYNERDCYAGRERLREEALQLLVANEKQNLLFVTGASGSGKSSFVQASLLPALVAYFEQRSTSVSFEVFRPSRTPKKHLDEAVRRLRSHNIKVLIIDQFEEIFTQSMPNERDDLFVFLKELSAPSNSKLYVIATLRSDYLGEMFDVPWLWNIAKTGIELREMRIQELKDAIQRPLQAKYPNGSKRFEARLVDKLAKDTAESATYIPLLQVTLEELWNKGRLKFGEYNSLTDAIKERANTVLTYHDFDNASPKLQRTEAEQEEVLSILLDLVNPSLDNDVRHDVRISRKTSEFNESQIALLRELSRARLISIEVEDDVEIANLIHEALIRSWDVLRNRINNKRLQLQKRVRFEEQLRLWIDHEQSDDYLLSKGQLVEALELNSSNDIAMRVNSAQEFVQKSFQKIEVNQQQAQELSNMRLTAEIANIINGSLTNSDDLFIKVVNLIREHFSFYHIAIFLNDRSKEFAVMREATGEAGLEMKRAGYKISIDSKSIVGFVSRQGEPFIANDITKDFAYANPLFPETRSEAAIPIKVNKQVLGVLDMQSTDPYAFSEDSLRSFQFLTNQMAIAIVNTELFKDTQEHISQHRLLHHITTKMASGLTLKEALKNAVNGLQVTLGGDRVIIFLADNEKKILEVKAFVGYAEDVAKIKIKIGIGIIGWAATHRKPLRINDVTIDSRYIQINPNTRSKLAVPLICRNELLGVLSVESEFVGAYTENDEEMLGTLCGNIAAIIKLFEKIDAKEESKEII